MLHCGAGSFSLPFGPRNIVSLQEARLSDFSLGLLLATSLLRRDKVRSGCGDLDRRVRCDSLRTVPSLALTILLAEGPLEKSVDHEIARKNGNGEKNVERHDEIDGASRYVGKS